MRYSLRTLLIVMLLAGPLCAVGWRAWVTRREAQQQREAIRVRLEIDGTMPTPQELRKGK